MSLREYFTVVGLSLMFARLLRGDDMNDSLAAPRESHAVDFHIDAA